MEDKTQGSSIIDQIGVFLTDLPLSEWHWLLLMVTLISLVCAISAWVYRRSHPDWRIRKKIKQLGPEYLVNLRIPDGMDGYTYIDYVVLTDAGLKLVSVKRFDGLIYGGESLEKWRQVTSSGSYEFPNPLRELEFKANALKTILPEVDTDALVLFEGRNSFPKSMPENVKLLDEFNISRTNVTIDEKLQLSWQRVCEISA